VWIRRLVGHWPAAGYRPGACRNQDRVAHNVLSPNVFRVDRRKVYLLHASGRAAALLPTMVAGSTAVADIAAVVDAPSHRAVHRRRMCRQEVIGTDPQP
jgi:hypothetical protein